MKNPKLLEDDESLGKRKELQTKKRSSGLKKRNGENRDIEQVNQFNIEVNDSSGEKRKGKHSNNEKRKGEQIIEAEVGELDKRDNESEDVFDEKIDAQTKVPKLKKSGKKKRKNETIKEAEIYEIEDGSKQKKGKSNKTRKIKKKDKLSQSEDGFLKNGGEAEHDEVYEISSGDEDSARGMKKWIMDYHQSRPGAKILQQRIDDFIVAHEAQEEQARKEREAQAAEGGWTVVVHHKGRKKTTDSGTGITVGSVAQAAVVDKMAKKKSKEVGLDFYRFQKREAQRNEIMMLQSKFEQDKKRIQQLRAARKFRPY